MSNSEQSREPKPGMNQTHFFEPSRLTLEEVDLKDITAPPGMPPESKLGERVRYARNALTLTIEALSRLTKEDDITGSGLSPASISRYESGESLPGLREFRLLVEALDVPMGWLMYGTHVERKPEFSNEDRLVLHALKSFIAATKDDSQIGNPSDAEWLRANGRMEKLNRARKPASEGKIS